MASLLLRILRTQPSNDICPRTGDACIHNNAPPACRPYIRRQQRNEAAAQVRQVAQLIRGRVTR